MKSQSLRAVTLMAGLVAAVLTGTAPAQDTANLYIAHAASGRELSPSTDPALPIDISVDGVCVVKGESFGDILGPFSFPVETVSFRISLANSLDPCTNPAVFTASTSLGAGTTLGVVSLEGSNVFGRVYPVNLSSIPIGATRAFVTNATSQNLSATVTYKPTTDGSGGQFLVPAGTMRMAVPPAGQTFTSIYQGGTNTLEAGPYAIETEPRNAYLYVLAGSVTNHSVQLIGPKVILNVL